MTAPLLSVESVSKRYRNGFLAVDGVSFAMAAGECLGVLGPNGAGKTTTVRMIQGASPITAGRVLAFGHDVAERPRDVKARLGVCPQENSLDPDLPVLENLVVYARYFGVPRREALPRAEELLAFMGLEARRDSGVMELSGGMQRRLVIARALVNRPELLILDEPTTGLDPQARHQVWERVEDLKRRGLGVLLTTHYMEEAARLADRLVIVDRGRVVIEGRPRELVRERVGESVIEAAEPPEALYAWLAERGIAHERLAARAIVYAGSDGQALYGAIREAHAVRDLALRMATLEDLFLRLTRRELRD